MLKKETIDLLKDNHSFINVFSICIGKTFLYQKRFIDYIGNYSRWYTDVTQGILKIDDRIFNVEYIGTTSTSDNYWYSSELENAIADEYVDIMINTRKTIETINLKELAEGKIVLENNINGYNLSMIYIAFAPNNVAYFCGSGDTSIYMFVKDLPESIFQKITPVEFPTTIMEIVSTFEVEHRLMLKALLIENEITYQEDQNNIIANFNENSSFTIKFENDVITNISGNIS